MSDNRDFIVELADLQRAMYPNEVDGAAVPRCWGVGGEPWLPVQMQITPDEQADLIELRVTLRRVATDGRATGTGEKKQCGRCGTTEDAIFNGCCFDCWITRAKDAEAALAAEGTVAAKAVARLEAVQEVVQGQFEATWGEILDAVHLKIVSADGDDADLSALSAGVDAAVLASFLAVGAERRAADRNAAAAALGRDARPYDEDGQTDAERRNVEVDGQGDGR